MHTQIDPASLRRKVPGLPADCYRAPRVQIPAVRLDFENIEANPISPLSAQFVRLEKLQAQRNWTRMLVAMVSEQR
jgi:hypothetical protein